MILTCNPSKLFRCLQFTKKHERLQEQIQAATEAQWQVESLGTMNAKLKTDSMNATVAAMPATAQTNASGHATLANAAKAPHDSCHVGDVSAVPCVAALRGQYSSFGTTAAALPKQCQSFTQSLLMHAPHSVGILTTAAAAVEQQAVAIATSAYGMGGPSASHSVWTSVGSTLRSALTGTTTAHAVLHQLVEALPEAILLVTRKAGSADDTSGNVDAAEAVREESAKEGKKTLGALWLVLATALRYSAADSTNRGPMNALSDEQVNRQTRDDFRKATEGHDAVSMQIKRLEMLVGSSRPAREATENCAKGVNGGGATPHAQSVAAAAKQPQGVGVSAAVAVEWLQAQSEAYGSVADVSTSNSSWVLDIASMVRQPMCETLRIATHETHALEMLFSVLSFAEVRLCLHAPFLGLLC